MDQSGQLLGAVEIDVRANLDKLVGDFAAGRAQTQAFANDMNRVVGSNQRFSGSTAQLSQQLNSLVRQYDPLRVAQQRYTQDVATLQTAQKAGLVSQTEAVALQGAMGRAFEDTQKKIEGQTVGLAGWARSTEHHLRAMRLLVSFVGVYMIEALGKFAIKTLEATAALKGQAEALGLTTAELQEYRLVATQVGMSSDDMDSAFKTLGHNIDDLRLGKVGPFSKMMVDFFGKTGAAAEKLKPISTIFKDMIDKLRDVGSEAQRQGANQIAFGEAGEKMGELEKRGSTGIDQLRTSVRAMGLVLSDKQINEADVTAKKLHLLWQTLEIKFASTVVENAQAIDTLATALVNLASISLSRFVAEIGALISRIEDLAGLLQRLPSMVPTIGGGSPELHHNLGADIHTISEGIGGYDYKTGRVTGLIGKAAEALGIQQAAPKSFTFQLPAARPPTEQPHGPNIDLGDLLKPKTPKGAHRPYDEFEADLAREKEQQLQLEREATGDITRQNEIDKEIIDLKLAEQVEAIRRQEHSKALTGPEAKRLIAEAQITAAAEKEAADRKMRIAFIEQQARYASEVTQLEQDGLVISRAMARTDKERQRLDLAILASKQMQAVSELDTQIQVAKENHEETRVAQLTEEMAKLKANQLGELKQFDIEHLTGIAKFKSDLAHTDDELADAVKNLRFDLFNQKLQQAAQFAGDIGDAFGQAAGDLARFQSPLKVATDLLTNLAQTFTKNFIEKPVADWATQHLGVPLAKQGFQKDLNKLAGPDALTAKEFDTALAQATGSLGALEHVAGPVASGFTSITAAADPAASSLTALTQAADAAASALTAAASSAGGAGGASGAGGILSSLIGAAGSTGGGGDAGTLDQIFSTGSASLDSVYPFGFASGGFTGSGGDGDVKGVVHANEYVLNSDAVGTYGTGLLSALNSGSASVLRTGGGSARPGSSGGGGSMNHAAAVLLQAGQELLKAAQALSGGGKKGGIGGFLGPLLGLVAGGILGGKGGGVSSLLSGLLGGGGGGGGGGGPAGLGSLLSTGDTNLDSIYSFGSGGFTGPGADGEIAGVVHRNELVWDAGTTRRFRPVLAMLGSGRVPGLGGGFGLSRKALDGPQPLHVSFGPMVFPNVTDARTARQSATQAASIIHRKVSRVARKGISTQ